MDLSRQRLLVPSIIKTIPILVIGAGSIGSNVTNVLCRMGAENVTLYDKDTLSPENVAPGFGGMNWLSTNKAKAVKDKIASELGTTINAMPYRYRRQHADAEIVIVTVDSMIVRQHIWYENRINGWKLWLDARMGKDQAGVYACRGVDDYKWYVDSINREGAALACGEKATAPICAGLVPGMVGIMVMRYIHGLKVPRSLFTKVLLEEPFFSVDM